MTFPPYQPSDQLSDVMAQIAAAKAQIGVLQVSNETADRKSQRFELAGEALESLVNAVYIMAEMQRSMQTDLAGMSAQHYQGSLNAANQILAYSDTVKLIDKGMKQAEDATDGLTASRGLRKALEYVIGLVDALMFSVRAIKSSIAQIDALRAAVEKIRKDVNPLLEAHREREARIDDWLKGALDGQDKPEA